MKRDDDLRHLALFASALLLAGCHATTARTPAESTAGEGRDAAESNPLLHIDFRWRYDRAQAQRLLDGKKYAEAEAAFLTLAESAPGALETAQCLARAAIARAQGEGEGGVAGAMTLTGRIAHGAWKAYAQMVILSTHEKFDELRARFKAADVAAWPEEIAGKGFHLRGRAYAAAEDLAAAVADYEAAWSRVPQRDRLWPNLVNAIGAYYQKLENDAQALETYQKAFAVYDGDAHWKGGSYHGRTVLAAAEVLQRLGRDQEALEVLTRYDIASKSVGFRVFAAAGDLYARLGRAEEAIAAYREAILQNEKYDQYADYNDALREKIAALEEGR